MPYCGYPTMPYYPAMTGFYRPPMTQPTYQSATPAQPGTEPVESNRRSLANVLPRPAGLSPQKDNDTPSEPVVRMRYIELLVSGVQDPRACAKLAASLDKLPGSRGSSVKSKGNDEAIVKVWYSDKEPLDADAIIDAIAKLGFKAVLAA